MTRGQLPKAYLRIDPNIDQTHPDNLEGFVRLLCAANRQPRRGWFKSRAVLTAMLGRGLTGRLFARGDVVETEGGVMVPGWDTWQEGDLDVGERVRRYRDRHRLTGRSFPVVPAVTEALPDRSPTSEASRQLGSKALEELNRSLTSGSDSDGRVEPVRVVS